MPGQTASAKDMNNSLLEHNPELAKEWHPTKNKDLTAADVSKGNNKKVWWQCPKGHSYEASINNRNRGSGCPFCSGRMTSKENSLSEKYPSIAQQWHPTKNGELLTKDLSYGSGKTVWWRCAKDPSREWQAKICSRTKRNNPTGCPYCKGNRLIADQNSLEAKSPLTAKEWHPELNKHLTPSEVRNGSAQKVWWLCSAGHSYQAQIGNRTKRVNPSGCPYCTNKLATELTSLASIGSALLKEWDEEMNGDLDPNKILAGSHKKAWWRCAKNHSWNAVIKSRVQGAGCPFCSNQSSTPEVRILSELEYIFPGIVSRYKEEKTEIDLFIPGLRVGVEYDGSYFHRAKEEKDKAKTQTLLDAGIHLIRARELPLKKLTDLDIEVSQKGVTKKDLNLLLRNILQAAAEIIPLEIHAKAEEYLNSREFINEDLFRKYVECFPDPLPQNSLINTHPDVAKEWHATKNTPLTPKNFLPGSNTRVWWLCPKGHEYETNIISRTTGHGCPVCSGNIVHESTALSTTHPELCKEWHPNRNGDLLPAKVSKGSTRKVWWVCEKCNHEWEAVIYNRSKSKNPSGCPRCWSKRRKGLPRQRTAKKDL